jgi:hypothetical protein
METIHHNPTIKAYLYSFGTHANNAFKTKNCNKVFVGFSQQKALLQGPNLNNQKIKKMLPTNC